MNRVVTRSAEETVGLGRAFSRSLRPGDVVAIVGNLGTGKTQFVKGVCEGFGVQANVSSPSFTLINEYPADAFTVVHIDLYRINARSEIAELGIEEYFNERFVCLIEWAETVLDLLPVRYRRVDLAYGEHETEREIRINERVEVAA